MDLRVKSGFLGGFLVSLGCYGLYIVPAIYTCYCEVIVWLSSTRNLNIGLFFDEGGVLFLSVVLIITGSIVFYCEWYIGDEVFKRRFFFLVISFVGSMAGLILIPNLVTLLIGWDGLGVTSFLLVVYYQRRRSIGAGIITALTNRIGDVLILVCRGYLALEGTWIVYEFVLVREYRLLGLGIIIARITKSAQLPFSAWLPEAIAAPTPVSALVHSSTLVTAGVYLVYRCKDILFANNVDFRPYTFLRLLTVILAGGAAIVEVDLKKIVAYSTLRQLGVIFFSLRIGYVGMALFHLCVHALFKALLFITVGVVIHRRSGCQDLRSLGHGWKKYPVRIVCIEVSIWSLCGLPFISGFYSKDYIIEIGILREQSFVLHFLLLVGLVLTFWYSIRFSSLVRLGLTESLFCQVWQDESSYVKMAYLSLLIGAVVAGWALGEIVQGFKGGLEVTGEDKILILLIGGLALYIYQIRFFFWHKDIKRKVVYFFGRMWGLKFIRGQWLGGLGLSYSDVVYRVIEKGWLEKVGPEGVNELFGRFGGVNSWVQGYHFFRLFMVFLIVIVGILFVVGLVI